MDVRTLDDAVRCKSDRSQDKNETAGKAGLYSPAAIRPKTALSTIATADVARMLERYHYREETRSIIENERLLPVGLLNRLQALYPQHSSLLQTRKFLFDDRDHYTGLKGFRAVVGILKRNGIAIGFIKEREFFVEVYRFLATRHTLNSVDWDNYDSDPIFQLVFPQPGMTADEAAVQAYKRAKTDEERSAIVEAYLEFTNPHDGNQHLNKPYATRSSPCARTTAAPRSGTMFGRT